MWQTRITYVCLISKKCGRTTNLCAAPRRCWPFNVLCFYVYFFASLCTLVAKTHNPEYVLSKTLPSFTLDDIKCTQVIDVIKRNLRHLWPNSNLYRVGVCVMCIYLKQGCIRIHATRVRNSILIHIYMYLYIQFA